MLSLIALTLLLEQTFAQQWSIYQTKDIFLRYRVEDVKAFFQILLPQGTNTNPCAQFFNVLTVPLPFKYTAPEGFVL